MAGITPNGRSNEVISMELNKAHYKFFSINSGMFTAIYKA